MTNKSQKAYMEILDRIEELVGCKIKLKALVTDQEQVNISFQKIIDSTHITIVEDMKWGGVLQLEGIMDGIGFSPDMFSIEEIWWDVQVVVSLLQINHVAWREI